MPDEQPEAVRPPRSQSSPVLAWVIGHLWHGLCAAGLALGTLLWVHAQQEDLLPRPLCGKSLGHSSINIEKTPFTLLEYSIANLGHSAFEKQQELVVEVLSSDVDFGLEVQGVSLPHPEPVTVEKSSISTYTVAQPRLDPGQSFGIRLAIKKDAWLPVKAVLRRQGRVDEVVTNVALPSVDRWARIPHLFLCAGLLIGVSVTALVSLLVVQFRGKRGDFLTPHVDQLCAAISEGVVSLSRATQEVLATHELHVQMLTDPTRAAEQLTRMMEMLKATPPVEVPEESEADYRGDPAESSEEEAPAMPSPPPTKVEPQRLAGPPPPPRGNTPKPPKPPKGSGGKSK